MVPALGVSLNASHTHNGANGASKAPMSPVSIGGRRRAPKVNSGKPMAKVVSPKSASSQISCADTLMGRPNGAEINPLSSADMQDACRNGRAGKCLAITIATAMVKVMPRASRSPPSAPSRPKPTMTATPTSAIRLDTTAPAVGLSRIASQPNAAAMNGTVA